MNLSYIITVIIHNAVEMKEMSSLGKGPMRNNEWEHADKNMSKENEYEM